MWEDCGDDDYSSNFVESKLSLVEHSVLRIVSPEDETALRRKLAWEDDEVIAFELTNARIIASNLMGTPISGTGNFAVHQREVTFVSFETSHEG